MEYAKNAKRCAQKLLNKNCENVYYILKFIYHTFAPFE